MAEAEEIWTNTFAYLDEVGEQITDEMTKILRDNNKFASGELVNSIDYDIEVDGNTIALVLQFAEHGKFVISGRKKGKFPPISSIKNWILDKRLQSRDMSLDSQAYVIARGIAKNGIKPLNFLSPVDKIKQSENFYNEVKKRIIEDINTQLKTN